MASAKNKSEKVESDLKKSIEQKLQSDKEVALLKIQLQEELNKNKALRMLQYIKILNVGL